MRRWQVAKEKLDLLRAALAWISRASDDNHPDVEESRRLTGGTMSLADALAQPGDADVDFEPPRLRGGLFKPADLG